VKVISRAFEKNLTGSFLSFLYLHFCVFSLLISFSYSFSSMISSVNSISERHGQSQVLSRYHSFPGLSRFVTDYQPFRD